MCRDLVDRVLRGKMGLGAREPGRGGARGPRRQRFHQLHRLGDVAAIERGLGAGELGLDRVAPDIGADAAQRHHGLELAEQALAEGIIGEVIGKGCLGDGGELGRQGGARGDAGLRQGLKSSTQLGELGIAPFSIILRQRRQQAEIAGEGLAGIERGTQPCGDADQRRGACRGQGLLLTGAARARGLPDFLDGVLLPGH